MATTALIVEILVVGALALTWMGLALVVLLLPEPTPSVTGIGSAVRDLAPLLALPFLALTYAVGWIVNFASEQALKPLGQRTLRRREFGDDPTAYTRARLRVLGRCSDALIADTLIDRHVVRLARGGLFNFFWFAIVSAGAAIRGWSFGWPLTGLCLLLAGASFAQWFNRQTSHYERIHLIDGMINSGALSRPSASHTADSPGAASAG